MEALTYFVCLIGEFPAESYFDSKYPNDIKKYYYRGETEVAESKDGRTVRSEGGAPCSLEFLHFPIRDFEEAEVESVIILVNELKRRIIDGDNIFMHCRGGHGYYYKYGI